MEQLFFILRLTLFSTIPLLIVALGGLFSEKSGVVNIALEGFMLLGAFAGIYVMFLIQQNGSLNGNIVYLIAMFVGGVTGMFFSLLHAYASISQKANQIISGAAINIFAPSFTIFFARVLTGTQQIDFIDNFMIEKVPLLSEIPLLGDVLFTRVYISTYVGFIILLVVYYVLFKSVFGLRLRSVGENPSAADSAGLNIYFYRYVGVLTSGFLAGLGGVALLIPTTTNFNATVSGFGYLALAVLIFGQWNTKKILYGSLFFGFMIAISSATGAIPFLDNLKLSSDWYNMIPYASTILVLALVSNNSRAPKAVGQPYDKGKR